MPTAALGRLHSVAEALRRARHRARARFDRVSFDLIYARQDQSPDGLGGRTGARAGAGAVDHLSLYQLTIEDGTAFGDRHRRGQLRGLPDEDRAVGLWDDDPGADRGRRAAGLRGVQPRPPRRGKPAQPDLLALRRLRRHRPRRAWPADRRRRGLPPKPRVGPRPGWRRCASRAAASASALGATAERPRNT